MSPDSLKENTANLAQLHTAVGELRGEINGLSGRMDDFITATSANITLIRQSVQETGVHVAALDATLASNCPRHEERIAALETSWHDFREKNSALMQRPSRVSTGLTHKAVTQADLDRAKDDTVRRAQEVIEADTEKKKDRFRKNVTWLLGTLATVLSLLGAGSVVTMLRYVSKVDSVAAKVAEQRQLDVAKIPKVVYVPVPVARDMAVP